MIRSLFGDVVQRKRNTVFRPQVHYLHITLQPIDRNSYGTVAFFIITTVSWANDDISESAELLHERLLFKV